jgi:hypothetical protein
MKADPLQGGVVASDCYTATNKGISVNGLFCPVLGRKCTTVVRVR